MQSKSVFPAMSRHLVPLCAALVSASALAQGNVASDNNSLSGDHLRAQTHVFGFIESSDKANPPPRCAPAQSGFSIRQTVSDTYTVRFYYVPKIEKPEKEQSDLDKSCLSAGLVSKDTSYTIKKDQLMKYDFKRSGVTFGGLVIPFKFRLGGDKGVTSSSTVAPYLGFTSRYLQFFGLSLDPVITAGLALVPVNNPATGTPESKSAFSFGGGFVLTSSKNEQFHAGLIFGKDVLSSSDRAKDPNVDKPWVSFYLGVAM